MPLSFLQSLMSAPACSTSRLHRSTSLRMAAPCKTVNPSLSRAAARDSSGTYPLIYGRDGAGAVVVANFGSAVCMLDGVAALDEVPPGCFIYGHRGIKPQRFAKTDAERTAAAAEAQDAAANALRGLVLGRPRALSSNASTDKDDRRRESFDSKEQRRLSNDWSRTGGGQSRLPWRRNSQGSGQSSREVSPPQQPGTPPAGTPRTSSGRGRGGCCKHRHVIKTHF